MINQERPIRKDILNVRYGDMQQQMLGKMEPNRCKKASIWWKDIMIVGMDLKERRDCFAGNVTFKVESGENTPLQYGRWIENEPLKLVYPILYQLREKPAGKVAMYERLSQDKWTWDFHINNTQMADENEKVGIQLQELIKILTNVEIDQQK